MNILYCGDKKMEDVLWISILSLLKNVDEDIHIYVLTMEMNSKKKSFQPVSDDMIDRFNKRVRQSNGNNSVTKIDLTSVFSNELPTANMETRFTPYCMLRLYADLLPELPDRILYLDIDVVCRKDISDFYHQDLSGCELVGVLDHYGKWFFRKNIFKLDYINSGVMLLNMEKIRDTGLFQKCRNMCRDKKMFMPDQSAVNELVAYKRIMPRRYNEQRRLHDDTILQHFTTSFRFFPWFHTLTVKPWQVERIHNKLKLHVYDDLLEEYQQLVSNTERFR